MVEYRIEKDSMGEIKVPADKLWGAQTQRSFENFQIGTEKIPMEMVTVFAYLKKAAAMVNVDLGVLDADGTERTAGSYQADAFKSHNHAEITDPISGIKVTSMYTGASWQAVNNGNFTFFLMNNGTIKCCGYNLYGQLGLGDTNQRNVPTTIIVKLVE